MITRDLLTTLSCFPPLVFLPSSLSVTVMLTICIVEECFHLRSTIAKLLRLSLNFWHWTTLIWFASEIGDQYGWRAIDLIPVWLVACLTSQQHTSVYKGRTCSDNCMCCHTELDAAHLACYLTQSQYTDTGPTSLSTAPIMPCAWQGCH